MYDVFDVEYKMESEVVTFTKPHVIITFMMV